ncbi:MAG TPA: SRPBCC domain-containing protein [Caulobacteraceae bacterium]
MIGRTDEASRLIHATPADIYRACTRAEALAAWRAPAGMTAEVLSFDPRPGGGYRMTLTYAVPPAAGGKSSHDSDVFDGVFLELEPDRRIVEEVRFDTDDPGFAGAMQVITLIAPAEGGADVTMRCENVPAGITAEDHQAGIRSTLANLAAFVEQPAPAAG